MVFKAYDSSILQKTNAATDDWKRDGYACYPEPPYDNTYDLNCNFSECFPAVLSPAIDETVRLNQEYLGFNKALYYPFGFENEPYPSMAVGTSVTVNARLGDIYTLRCGRAQLPSGAVFHGNEVSKLASCTESGIGGYSYYESDVSVAEGITGWNEILATSADEYGNFGSDVICSKFKRNGNGFRCIDKPKPPATKELAIERYASEYPAATICDPLKQNSPFKCTPTDTPPTTKALAIERYTAAYTLESICAPLKLNSPFQCTRNVEVPTTTILSLSVASAQAVFAAGGLVFVSLLRKLEKPGKNTATSVDDDLRVLVRKLRVGQDELRDKREFPSS